MQTKSGEFLPLSDEDDTDMLSSLSGLSGLSGTSGISGISAIAGLSGLSLDAIYVALIGRISCCTVAQWRYMFRCTVESKRSKLGCQFADETPQNKMIYRVCQKKDILNIQIKSEGINIFSQKFC